MEDIMSHGTTVSARILDMVSQAPGCRLDELLSVSSDLTCNYARIGQPPLLLLFLSVESTHQSPCQ